MNPMRSFGVNCCVISLDRIFLPYTPVHSTPPEPALSPRGPHLRSKYAQPQLALHSWSHRRSGLFAILVMSDSITRDLTGPECNGDVKTDAVSPNVTEVVVIRHGETEWNASNRIQGHLDVDLNDVGRQQAIAVAERLSREPKISVVYTSDLKRGYETAETIARICGRVEVVKEPELRERHVGDLQGVVYHEASKICTKAWQAFVSHQSDLEIPGGGESREQLHQRSTTALQRIAKKHRGERIAVVTHGGFIRALHRRASSPSRSPGKVLNTSVNVFHLSDEDEWTIKAWGDVSHLNQTGFLESGFGGDKNSG